MKRGKSRSLFTAGRLRELQGLATLLLRDWRDSRWESEAAVRYGLRGAFVLEGYGWAESDEEAASIVRFAFNSLGRGKETRPSEEEGQRYYVEPRENCRWCHGAIDQSDMTGNRNRQFCCDEHARFAYQEWGMRNALQGNAMQREAYRAAYRDRMPSVKCAVCETSFKLARNKAPTLYCSIACSSEARRKAVPSRICEECGGSFYPSPGRGDARFCSRACQGRSRQIHKPVSCFICAVTFIPRTADVECCSKACANKKAALKTIAVDCLGCGRSFDGRPGSRYCGKECSGIANRIRYGKLTQLKAAAFDHLMARQGARITDGLFAEAA